VKGTPARARAGRVGQLELVGEEKAELDDGSQQECEYDGDQRELNEGLGPLRTAAVRKN